MYTATKYIAATQFFFVKVFKYPCIKHILLKNFADYHITMAGNLDKKNSPVHTK